MSRITPHFIFRKHRRLTAFIASKQLSTISTMEPKISEGQDESKLITEMRALAENGWILDDQDMGIKKTYYFKTYTKALVTSIS